MASAQDKKISALKKLQLEYIEKQEVMYKEIHDLEIKMEKLMNPLYLKRYAIVAGLLEASDDEDKEDTRNKGPILSNARKGGEDSGIPGFWLKALQNSSSIAQTIELHDEPILQHLVDIRVTTRSEPMGFDLSFHFTPNKYFDDPVLTKIYDMRSEPDSDEPYSYDGPEIVRCKGCTISWKKGMNVTIDTTKSKYNCKGNVKVVKKTYVRESFFNFFEPPVTPEDKKLDEDTQSQLEDDFEIGNLLRTRLIPHAVLYFNGEMTDGDSDDEEYDEEDEESSEDDIKDSIDIIGDA